MFMVFTILFSLFGFSIFVSTALANIFFFALVALVGVTFALSGIKAALSKAPAALSKVPAALSKTTVTASLAASPGLSSNFMPIYGPMFIVLGGWLSFILLSLFLRTAPENFSYGVHKLYKYARWLLLPLLFFYLHKRTAKKFFENYKCIAVYAIVLGIFISFIIQFSHNMGWQSSYMTQIFRNEILTSLAYNFLLAILLNTFLIKKHLPMRLLLLLASGFLIYYLICFNNSRTGYLLLAANFLVSLYLVAKLKLVAKSVWRFLVIASILVSSVIAIFLWQVFNDKINIAPQLLQRTAALRMVIDFREGLKAVKHLDAVASNTQTLADKQKIHSHSSSERRYIYALAWQKWRKNMFLGSGIGNYKFVDLANKVQTNPHSQVLALLVELGLVGLIFYFGFCGLLIKACWDRVKTCLQQAQACLNQVAPCLHKTWILQLCSLNVVIFFIIGSLFNTWMLDFTPSLFFIFAFVLVL